MCVGVVKGMMRRDVANAGLEARGAQQTGRSLHLAANGAGHLMPGSGKSQASRCDSLELRLFVL